MEQYVDTTCSGVDHDGQWFSDGDIQPGLFPHLTDGGLRRVLTPVHESAGESPTVAVPLAQHEQSSRIVDEAQ
jgi:hypothetical protein